MIGRRWATAAARETKDPAPTRVVEAGASHRPLKGEDGASALDADGRRRVALSIAADCGWPTIEAMRDSVALVLGR